MKILITGGTGFVGSHLSNLLLRDGHEITLVARNMDKRANIEENFDKVTTKICDITDFIKLENTIKEIKPDVIFHLAGETSHKKSFENPLYDVDVNTKSTLCILETIRNSLPTCKFILGSTFIVVGKPKQLPINEDSSCNPTTIYGTDRLSSEYYNTIYHNVYGLQTLTFRITNSFGPKEQYLTPTKNAINYLIYQAYKGNEVTIYDEGKFFRDLIFINDVISAIKTIMDKGVNGNLYWISSGKKTWFYDIGNWLEELTNSKVKYIQSPEYAKKTDVGNFVVDNSKLKSLGWNQTVDIKKGIELTLDYFRTHNL